MSGVGVITNPRSRHNRRDPRLARHLGYLLGERGELASPDDLEDLAATARRFHERAIDVLCVNGGDGTVHKAITAMMRAYGDDPLPPVAILRGGTMNIVAESIGLRLGPGEMLERVVDAWHAGEALPRTERRLMRVDTGEEVVHGFLFGNGIIARFLEVYYEHGDPTPLDAAWLLLRGSLSAFVRGPLIRRLTRPYEGSVEPDDQVWEERRWMAVAAGTVEQMGLGFTPFHRVPHEPDRLHLVGIGGSVVDLARELPSVYRGQGLHRPRDREQTCARVVLRSGEPIPLMVDGDFYEGRGEVRLEVGPGVTFLLP